MSSKIHLKVGQIEISYEGDENLANLKKILVELLQEVINLAKKENLGQVNAQSNEESASTSASKSNNLLSQLTTNTIARKLNVKSGSDLIIAACACLTLSKEKSEYDRLQILSEMQSAKSYYKNSHRSNLSNYLNTLSKIGKLNDRANNRYALSSDEEDRVRKEIA